MYHLNFYTKTINHIFFQDFLLLKSTEIRDILYQFWTTVKYSPTAKVKEAFSCYKCLVSGKDNQQIKCYYQTNLCSYDNNLL